MLTFNSSHIKTISELQKIAEKHKYDFFIFVTSPFNHPDDFEITKKMQENNEDLKFINDYHLLIGGNGKEEKFEYCFRSKKDSKIHSLIYTDFSGHAEYDESSYEEMNSNYELYDEYGGSFVYYDFTETRVLGFENIDYIPNVYRQGIMLREFYFMICKLTGEEIIHMHY